MRTRETPVSPPNKRMLIPQDLSSIEVSFIFVSKSEIVIATVPVGGFRDAQLENDWEILGFIQQTHLVFPAKRLENITGS